MTAEKRDDENRRHDNKTHIQKLNRTNIMEAIIRFKKKKILKFLYTQKSSTCSFIFGHLQDDVCSKFDTRRQFSSA